MICNVISLELLVRVIPFTQMLSCQLLVNRAVSYFQCVCISMKGSYLKVSLDKEDN